MDKDAGAGSQGDVNQQGQQSNNQQQGNQEGSQQSQYVPMSDYIGLKEMLRKREAKVDELREELTNLQNSQNEGSQKAETLEAEVKSLNEQLAEAKKSAVDPEQIKNLTKERDDARAGLLQTRRDVIVKTYGVNPEDIKEMSAKELEVYEKGLAAAKGQGSTQRNQSDRGEGQQAPPEGAFNKYRAGFDSLHPSS